MNPPKLPISFVATAAVLLLAGPLAQNTPIVSAADSDSGGHYQIFLPFVAVPVDPNAPDLIFTSVEITQGVQDANNSVTLIANRATVVRVFVEQTNPTDEPIWVSLHATRNGVPLPNSPLSATQPLPNGSTAPSLDSTFNFTLPPQWLAGDIELTVTIDPTQAIRERDESNNSATLTTSFVSVAPLEIVIVPITYTHQPNGLTYAATTEDKISDYILATYPVPTVNVSIHTPIAFTGDLKTTSGNCKPSETPETHNCTDKGWIQLLQTVTTLKQSENAPNATVYLGFVPGHQQWWSYGGIAGMAWIGYRVGTSLDLWYSPADTARIAAHEIGHTFGRQHAPCGTSGDINYPYRNGQIGVYGLDIASAAIKVPTQPDIMGYCGNAWFSDYTYEAMLTNQLQIAGSTPNQSSSNNAAGLLIRADLTDTGASLYPAYALTAPTTSAPADSPYEVIFRDAQGNIVSRAPIAPLSGHVEAGIAALDDDHAHDEVTASVLNAIVPAPTRPYTTYEITFHGQVIAQHHTAPVASRITMSAGTNPTPATLITTGSDLTLTWGDTSPAIVRFVATSGETTTLAVDITTGQLTLPANAITAAGHFEILTENSLTTVTVTH